MTFLPDAEYERVLRDELRPLRFGAIMYAARDGCGGSKVGYGGTPRACDVDPEFVAIHVYEHPAPPRRWRVFLCEWHARLMVDPLPMTDTDRAELDGRRVRVLEALAGRLWEPCGPVVDELDGP